MDAPALEGSSTLPTEVALAIVAGALVSLPVSLFVLSLYRRAVLKCMAQASPAPDPSLATAARRPITAGRPPLRVTVNEEGAPPRLTPALEKIRLDALARPWRTAGVYAAGGAAFATTLAVATLVADGQRLLPIRLALLAWVYFWPAVLTTNLVAASTKGRKVLVVLAYLAVFGLLGAIGIARTARAGPGEAPPTPSQFLTLLSVFGFLPTLAVGAFLNRRIRAVGPLVLSFMVVAFAGVMAAPHVAESSPTFLRLFSRLAAPAGITGRPAFALILLSGFALAAVLGWAAVAWLRKAYEAKRLSDQSLTVDAIWLFFAVIGAVFPASGANAAAWLLAGPASFAAYKVGTSLGLRLMGRPDASGSVSLLLLRVFALGRRSARLFDLLSVHWRQVGPIQLISGPDLATTTVEPHEFLSFLTGKVGRLFIGGAAALRQRLEHLDARRDPDGRYRVNEFFCRDDTWRAAVSSLAARSGVVLMDVRGFSAANAGCTYELHELLQVAPLGRILLTVDDTTDLPFLKRVLQDGWERTGSDSPNAHEPSPEIRLHSLEASVPDPRAFLGWLCQGPGRATDFAA